MISKITKKKSTSSYEIDFINLTKNLLKTNGKKNGKKNLLEYGFTNPIKSYPKNKNFVDIYKTNQKFDLICADPPWNYPISTSKMRMGAIGNSYPVMTTHDICKLPVKNILKKNAILLLWTTSMFLPHALKVIEAWGFTYVTVWMYWNKTYTRHSAYLGMGTYSRNGVEPILFAYKTNIMDDVINKHKFFPAGYHLVKDYDGKGNTNVILDETEMLLLGKKGSILKNFRVKDQGKIPSNILEVPVDRTKHSKKPAKVYKLINDSFPHCETPLDLFSRKNIPWNSNTNWSVWGNECEFI